MKELKMLISASFQLSNRHDGRWCLTIQDESSGTLICSVEVDPESFYRIMSSRGCVSAKGQLFDTYGIAGLIAEHKTVLIQDSRLGEIKDWKRRYEIMDAIIDDHRPAHEVDGWKMVPLNNSLSHGQHEGDTLEVRMVRYVPTTPGESQRPPEGKGGNE